MTTLIPKYDLKNGGTTPTGAVNRAINEKLYERISVKDFGAIGDNIADDTVAFQNAIAYSKTLAVTNGGAKLYIPAGNYKISSALDFTMTYGFVVEGDGPATILRFNGVNTVCIDMTASYDMSFRDFTLAVSTGAPDAGILMARGISQECSNNFFLRVEMFGGFNKAVIYNYCSEGFYMYDCLLSNVTPSGCAYLDTGDNLGTNEGITSPFTTIGSGAYSNTLKYFYTSEFASTATTGVNDAIRLRGLADFAFDGCFIVNALSATPSRSGVYIDITGNVDVARGSFTNFRFEGGRQPGHGFYVEGSNQTILNIDIHDGVIDTPGSMLYCPTGKISGLNWYGIYGNNGLAVTVNRLELSTVKAQAINILGTLYSSTIWTDLAISVIVATDHKNNYFDITTGQYIYENLNIIQSSQYTGMLTIQDLRVTGGSAATFKNSTGSSVGAITTNGTNTAYVTSSDYRLKENILPMTGALNTISALKPVTYDWISNKSKGQGFIAHELQAIVPDAVVGKKDEIDEKGQPKYQGVDTSYLVATLVSAVQELKAEVDALKAK